MLSFIKKNKFLLITSFLLPLVIMALNFSFIDISWGSSKTVLAGDAYHQYVSFHALFSTILHQGSGFLYTFTSGLGLNFLSFSSYYLGSFLIPLTYFFDVSNMPDGLYIITLLKFGCIGLSAFISFKLMYRSLSKWLVLSLSTTYALMSFIVNQSEIIMWLDVFIWLPLIICGLHLMIDQGKRKLYFISLTILFTQNYYFGFMMALFLVGYFLVRLTFDGWSIRKLVDFSITSLLSGLASMIMVLPMFLDLRANGESFTKVTSYFTEKSWYFDLFAKNFIASYDTTQYGAIPTIYIGLFTLILACLFFTTTSIKLRTKIAYFTLLSFIVASFYLRPLDLFWQGMHTPNMFLHRYSFVFSLLIILMAAETLIRLKEIRLRWIISVALLLLIGFVATIVSDHYQYITFINISLTLLFAIAYLTILISHQKKWLLPHYFSLFVILFGFSELAINAYYQINSIDKEWHYTSRTNYDQNASRMRPIVNSISSDKDFYRLEQTSPDTGNDGMKYNFNSLSQFSSVRNRKSASTLNLLGFKSTGTNLNLRYPLNTILMDAIFNIRYNVNTTEPTKFGFNALNKSFPNLTSNAYVLPPAIFVKNGYRDVKLTENNIIGNQTQFVNRLSGQNNVFYSQFYVDKETTNATITGNHNRITLTKKDNNDINIHYTATAPAGKQSYLKFANATYQNRDAESVKLTVNGHDSYINTNDTGSLINLGYFTTPTTLDITLSFPNNQYINFDTIELWALDVNAYTSNTHTIKQNKVTASAIKNGLKTTVSAQSKGDLFFTLPYDKGWSAKVDGKTVKIKQAQTGFMTVPVSKGSHTVVLHFVPAGLKIGILCFISAIILFFSYDRYLKKELMLNNSINSFFIDIKTQLMTHLRELKIHI